MKSNTVVQLGQIQKVIPHHCLSYQEALGLTFQKIAQNEVVSSWMDAWDIKGENPDIHHFIQVPQEGCLRDQKKVLIKGSKEAVIDRIWRIGGETGYYSYSFLWKIRGIFDQMIGGVGLNRGRRDPTEIQAGDSIDFWRVILADKKQGKLLLFAEMKIPGEAWLEFKL